jgi:2-amino-4-hydroxy-6-hydroxymethyldihydropteridine diphosphokinase
MPPSPPPATGKTAFLGLGSNLGDRRENLAAALGGLSRDPETRVVAVSSLYATAPVGLPGAPEFINAVAGVETRRAPEDLLELCLAIEAGLGRVRTGRAESRPIDIDLLTFGDLVRMTARLSLPHPRMRDRAFVMIPLAEIAPEASIEGRPASYWAEKTSAAGVRKLRIPGWPPAFGR